MAQLPIIESSLEGQRATNGGQRGAKESQTDANGRPNKASVVFLMKYTASVGIQTAYVGSRAAYLRLPTGRAPPRTGLRGIPLASIGRPLASLGHSLASHWHRMWVY